MGEGPSCRDSHSHALCIVSLNISNLMNVRNFFNQIGFTQQIVQQLFKNLNQGQFPHTFSAMSFNVQIYALWTDLDEQLRLHVQFVQIILGQVIEPLVCRSSDVEETLSSNPLPNSSGIIILKFNERDSIYAKRLFVSIKRELSSLHQLYVYRLRVIYQMSTSQSHLISRPLFLSLNQKLKVHLSPSLCKIFDSPSFHCPS